MKIQMSGHGKSFFLNMQMYIPEFPSLDSCKLYINIKTLKYHQLVKGQDFPQ